MPLISKQRAQQIAAAAEERGQGAQSVMPMGVNVLRISKVEGKHTKEGNVPMVVMTYSDLDNNYRSIDEYFKIDDGPGAEILAARLKVFNAHNLPEIETLDELVKYVTKHMLSKKIKAAVRHEERLYKKTEDEWYKNVDARVAYIGSADEDMTFDASKALKPLNAEQQHEWDSYLARKSGSSPAAAAATSRKPATKPADDDDLDAPVTAPAKAAPKKPEVVKPTADDDLDIEERIPATPSSTGERPATGKATNFLDDDDL